MYGIFSVLSFGFIVVIYARFISSKKHRFIIQQFDSRLKGSQGQVAKRMLKSILTTTIFFLVLSLAFGHYSRSIEEYEFGWVLLPIMLSYLYVVLLIIAAVLFFLASKFSMSGYR